MLGFIVPETPKALADLSASVALLRSDILNLQEQANLNTSMIVSLLDSDPSHESVDWSKITRLRDVLKDLTLSELDIKTSLDLSRKLKDLDALTLLSDIRKEREENRTRVATRISIYLAVGTAIVTAVITGLVEYVFNSVSSNHPPHG